MSPFVKTAKEVEEIESLLAKGDFTVEAVTVEFETTMEFLREVLPPCFDLPQKPTASASVSRWQSNLCGEFNCGIVFLNCSYKGIGGTTMLTLFVSGDSPVTIGRELWGEGKKTGTAELYIDGGDAYGYTERNGVRLIEITAELGPDQGQYTSRDAMDFELKAQPHTTGRGLQGNVILTGLRIIEDYNTVRSGPATLKFAGTPFDPLDTIPVVSVGAATYSIGEASTLVDFFDELSAETDYRPYIYGQKYDDFRLFSKAARFRRRG